MHLFFFCSIANVVLGTDVRLLSVSCYHFLDRCFILQHVLYLHELKKKIGLFWQATAAFLGFNENCACRLTFSERIPLACSVINESHHILIFRLFFRFPFPESSICVSP
jgi:hypothetical protein